ncbi:MAG: polysaccharide pyruvyl transferase family protein, partial [Chloroflexi bacterium]|nr:polysaccharide pyruvyl transferase family protein [Chloroflexota bacterium]
LRVGISGSYGGLNLGDEAILQGIVSRLRASLPVHITVISRDASDTMRRHRVDNAVNVRTLSREEVTRDVEVLDLLILGGGGILYDTESRIYLREEQVALEKGVSTMLYAIGAGPLNTADAQTVVRDTLEKVDVLTVRDHDARKLLEDIGVHREIIVAADPALFLKPEPVAAMAYEGEHLGRGRRVVGISVREPGGAAPDLDEKFYHGLVANAADFMIDRFDAEVVFFPMERRAHDHQHAHSVVAQMLRPQRAHVLSGEYTSGQMLSLIRRCQFCVGMRLHFLIFAALQHVPFVALPYAAKVEGFLNDLQIETPPLKLVNAGRLIAYIDRSWDIRKEVSDKVSSLLPALKRRALVPNRLAVKLLREAAARRRYASGLPDRPVGGVGGPDETF